MGVAKSGNLHIYKRKRGRRIKKYNVHATIEKGKRFLYRPRARDEIIGIEKKGGNSTVRKKTSAMGKLGGHPSKKTRFFKVCFSFRNRC